MNKKILLAIIPTSIIVSGCITESIDLSTNEFTSQTTILSSENETIVTSDLRRDDKLPYALHETDSLASDYNGDNKPMTRANTNIYYSDGNFSFSLLSAIGSKQAFSSKYEGNLAGQDIAVSFNRADNTSYESTVRIPEASNILSPTTTDVFYFDLDREVTVTWDNASISQSIRLNFQTECSENNMKFILNRVTGPTFFSGSEESNVTLKVDDTGSANISIIDILDIRVDYEIYKESIEIGGFPEFKVTELDCQTELFIIRENEGIVDQNLNEDSNIKAKTSRKMSGSFQILLEEP